MSSILLRVHPSPISLPVSPGPLHQQPHCNVTHVSECTSHIWVRPHNIYLSESGRFYLACWFQDPFYLFIYYLCLFIFCFKWHNFMFLLVFVCGPVGACIHTCTQVCACGSQRLTLCLSLSSPPFSLLRKGPITQLELFSWLRCLSSDLQGSACPLSVPAAALRLQRHVALCGASRLNSGPCAPTDATYPLSHLPAQLPSSLWLDKIPCHRLSLPGTTFYLAAILRTDT